MYLCVALFFLSVSFFVFIMQEKEEKKMMRKGRPITSKYRQCFWKICLNKVMSAGKKYANNPLSILCVNCCVLMLWTLIINHVMGSVKIFFLSLSLFLFSILFLWFRWWFFFSPLLANHFILVKQSYDLSNACMMIKITRKEHQSVYLNVVVAVFCVVEKCWIFWW